MRSLAPIVYRSRMKTTPVLATALAGLSLVLIPSLLSVLGQSSGRDLPRPPSPQPVIRSARAEGTNVVLVVLVPQGVRKIVLESRSRAESGPWVHRELRWPDGNPGTYTFVLPRTKDLEVMRISSSDMNTLPLSASEYQDQGAITTIDDPPASEEFVQYRRDRRGSEDPPPPPREPDSSQEAAQKTAPAATRIAERHAKQRLSIASASRSNTQPERLSPDFPPRPFLAAEYVRNPEAYLEVIEPGRCWQTASEESDAPELVVANDRTEISVPAHGSVELSLQIPAGAPATFSSFGGGTFPNTLNSITVEADSSGRATTSWAASAGTVLEALIVASSPQARGTAQFRLTVQGPTTAPHFVIAPSRKGGAR